MSLFKYLFNKKSKAPEHTQCFMCKVPIDENEVKAVMEYDYLGDNGKPQRASAFFCENCEHYIEGGEVE